MFDAENTRRQQQASIEDDKPPLRALLVEDNPSLAVVTAPSITGVLGQLWDS